MRGRWVISNPVTYDAFEVSNNFLLSLQILVHLGPVHPIILACGASAHWIGAVLLQKFVDGSE